MTARISSFGMQNLAIASMQKRQVEMSHTQQQLASGKRLLSGRDDPVAAGVALALDRTQAEIVRFGANANVLQHRLALEESALANVNDHVSRLREIALQANGGIQTDESRRAFLAEVKGHMDALVALGNSSDGQGRFLFGGTKDASAPFVRSGGTVTYVGDQIQREIDIAPEVAVADADPGSEIFLRVPTGDGRVTVRADGGNTGTGVLQQVGFVQPADWDGGNYSIEFLAGNYRVLDGGGTQIATGPFVAGDAIDVAGYQITITGTPADGDSFAITPAPTASVFETAQALHDILSMSTASPDARAAQQNAFFAVIQDLGKASDHAIDSRSAVGARMSALDNSAEEREAQLVAVKGTLSSIRDLDYAQAISDLSRQSAVLEAAQQSYLRINSMSLFQML